MRMPGFGASKTPEGILVFARSQSKSIRIIWKFPKGGLTMPTRQATMPSEQRQYKMTVANSFYCNVLDEAIREGCFF